LGGGECDQKGAQPDRSRGKPLGWNSPYKLLAQLLGGHPNLADNQKDRCGDWNSN